MVGFRGKKEGSLLLPDRFGSAADTHRKAALSSEADGE